MKMAIMDFNMYMLAKQLWRLIEKPNILSARVFKDDIIDIQIFWFQLDHTHYLMDDKVLYQLDHWLTKN